MALVKYGSSRLVAGKERRCKTRLHVADHERREWYLLSSISSRHHWEPTVPSLHELLKTSDLPRNCARVIGQEGINNEIH
jgi:hypothetical protein